VKKCCEGVVVLVAKGFQWYQDRSLITHVLHSAEFVVSDG
jgi:hypothetical protein